MSDWRESKMAKFFIVIFHIFIFINLAHSSTKHDQPKPKRKTTEPTNNIILEKFEFEVYNKTLLKDVFLDLRPIARNVHTINISSEITEPLNETWFRCKLFYKYQTYQKFFGDAFFDGCRILNKTTFNPVADILLKNTMRALQMDGVRMSFKMQCPFYGRFDLWHPGLNFSTVNMPLLPAGRYRGDFMLSRTEKGSLIGIVRSFFQISDLRVWF